ncbi:NADH-quinone oxidoreductase subunit G [Streptomyces sp. DvalAA-14]|nr:NADH-quinone oxidoreductase subunit G [Streptomyces sp. DvalAA-14]
MGPGRAAHPVGRDTGQIIEAAASGELAALVVGGVEVADLPDPARARAALDAVGFLVSLEQRPSEVTERADVVLPVAAVAEKSGAFLNWEGRMRPFEAAIKPDQATTRHRLPDARVLTMLADALDVSLGLSDVRQARAELDRLAAWSGTWATAPTGTSVPLPRPESGQAVLAGHRLLLDLGRLQEGDDALTATRHAAVARLSAATAAEAGVSDGQRVRVTGPAGAVTLPLAVTPMPDRVVWLPLNSVGGGVASDTGVRPGQIVAISSEGAE